MFIKTGCTFCAHLQMKKKEEEKAWQRKKKSKSAYISMSGEESEEDQMPRGHFSFLDAQRSSASVAGGTEKRIIQQSGR